MAGGSGLPANTKVIYTAEINLETKDFDRACEALDGIDIGALYTAYIDALQTLHPAEEQEPADNGSGEDGTEAGSPDSTDGTAE